MASGRQYYKYKEKAELLKNMIFDIRSLLLVDESNNDEKIRKLARMLGKYEYLAEHKDETL